MPDVFSPAERSRIMAKVRGKDSKGEKLVRSLVHSLGYRFRLHRRDLPGCPDVVLRRRRKVIFVHGCFWHGHKKCRKSARPQSNVSFWQTKLDRNMERDKKNIRALQQLGWKVLIV